MARAIAQRCDYVILDEATNHLDIRYQIEVLELLTRLSPGGKTQDPGRLAIAKTSH